MIFFLPLFFITKKKQNSKLLTGLGKASVCQALANEEDLEKRNNHQSGKEGAAEERSYADASMVHSLAR